MLAKKKIELTDGWFREISEMWPGQAMTLKVNKILHHEKSLYQDVRTPINIGGRAVANNLPRSLYSRVATTAMFWSWTM